MAALTICPAYSLGETTLVEWKNTPITGQIQVTKTSAEYNTMNGWPAGTPLPNTERLVL